MNTTKGSEDYRSEQLDQLIQSSLQWDPLDDDFIPKGNGEILDFIMANPDLSLTYDQILLLLIFVYCAERRLK